MLVLHATHRPGAAGNEPGLFLWGEDPDRGVDADGRASVHPFRAERRHLTEAVAAVSAGGPVSAPADDVLELLLPTLNGAPVPSPQSFAEPAAGRQRKPRLRCWRVDGIRLPPAAAVFWLAAVRTDETATGRALPGADLLYWSAAAKLVLALLARGRYVPSLAGPEQPGGTDYVGTWLPVLTASEDRQPLDQLAATMPELCRAVAADGGTEPRCSPRQLLRAFLGESLAACLRQWLAEDRPPTPTTKRGKPRLQSADTAWLDSLRSLGEPLHARAGHVQRLVEGVQTWLAELGAGAEATARTCFRLEPPDGDQLAAAAPDDWLLSFHLQSLEDPSLLLPAKEIWRASARSKKLRSLKLDRPRERLLADLGKASRLAPPVKRGLATSKPAGCGLTNLEAYEFLRAQAWLLEESGFGVQVPPWWKKGGAAGARLGVKATLRSTPGPQTTGGGMGLDALVTYDWQVALGEETLTRQEFERLAELKAPLVKVRGQWVELRPDQLEAALKFFESGGGGREMTLGEAMRLAQGLDAETTGLPVMSVEAEGDLSTVLGRLTGEKRLGRLKAPKGFDGTLRPYQRLGYSWLAFLREVGIGGCLADDMGLGKTIQLLALLLREVEAGKQLAPTLLICPTSVVSNWQREAERFTPSLRVLVHHGPDRRHGKALAKAVAAQHLVVTTYQLAQRDQEDLAQVEWQGVVLDEAQNIKNPSAKQTQAIRSLEAQYRFALTGTPVENRLSELWSIMHFLNPGYLGSQKDFRTRFALPIERYGIEEASTQLRGLVQPLLLRRLKTDPKIISDLPEKTEMTVFCSLSKEQATLYQAVVDDMLNAIDDAEGIERRGKVLAALSKLKQICNHPAQFLGDGSSLGNRSGKLNRLREMVDEVIAEGHKALLFTQFSQMGELLQHDLRHRFAREVLFLHGGVTKKKRDEMVERFQTETGPPLFVLSLKAGGVGLNLTEANHVFHFDRWWNPAVENQATDRAFRIGQKRNVLVQKFVCTGTLEERIQDMLEQKKELADSIVGAGENWITELSTGELKELFELQANAVNEEATET